MAIRVLKPPGMTDVEAERRLRAMEADILAALGIRVTCVVAPEPVVAPLVPYDLTWLEEVSRHREIADSETSSDEDWDAGVTAMIAEVRRRRARR